MTQSNTSRIIVILSILFLSSSSIAQPMSADTTIPLASFQSFLNQTYIGGYGEMSYTNPNYGDVPRLSVPVIGIYLEHYFSGKWAFHSEFDVENVQVTNGVGGTAGFQQAYLDYKACSLVGWRGGLLLIPMGIINQEHDPTTYFSVERPLFDQEVIPTTWREIGTGMYGDITHWLNYQLYITEGLQAEGFTMNTSAGGRQDGSDGILGSDASHPAGSARLAAIPCVGLQLGASLYYEANAFDSIPSGTIGTLIMLMGDARYEVGALHIRAEGGFWDIGPGGSGYYLIPSHAAGGYGEIAYNVFSFCPNCTSQLLPFVRYENFTFTGPDMGTYAAAPAGPTVGHTSITAGVAFKPLSDVILKADYRETNVQGESDFHEWSFGGGFSF